MNPKVKSRIITILILLLLAVAVLLVIGYMDVISSHRSKDGDKKNGVNVQELSFYDGDEKIFGKLFLPDGEKKENLPTLIYVHGFGLNGESGEQICKAAAEMGIASYAFDFRGGGPQSRSSGSMMEMSVESEIKDLDLVVKRLRKMSFCEKRQIYLMGHSQGGLVATMEASRHHKEIAGLILLAPAFDIPKKGKDLYPKVSDIPDTSKVGKYYVGKAYYSDIRSLQPYKEMKSYKKPVLIIHGDKDTVVNLQWSDVALQILKNSRLEVIENCNHNFTGDGGEKALEFTREYLRQQTGLETSRQARQRRRRTKEQDKDF